jgi:hypothetical protein
LPQELDRQWVYEMHPKTSPSQFANSTQVETCDVFKLVHIPHFGDNVTSPSQFANSTQVETCDVFKLVHISVQCDRRSTDARYNLRDQWDEHLSEGRSDTSDMAV